MNRNTGKRVTKNIPRSQWMRIQYAEAYIIFVDLQTGHNDSDQKKYPHKNVPGVLDKAG